MSSNISEMNTVPGRATSGNVVDFISVGGTYRQPLLPEMSEVLLTMIYGIAHPYIPWWCQKGYSPKS